LSALAEPAPACAAALQGREEVINHETAPRRDRRCLVCGGAGSTAGRRRHPPAAQGMVAGH